MQELIIQNLREAASILEKFINQPENIAAVEKLPE
jgi:hypothetical protein